MRLFLLIGIAAIHIVPAFSQNSVGEWTWMKGDSIWGNDYNTLHSFGDKGVYSENNIVPKLYGASSWSAGSRLYLLDGYYLDTNNGYSKNMNAMWEYNIDSNEWAWISGPGGFNAPG
ncbi:MAG: hypothetical protein ABIQ74_00890, partial [Chitinophagales bacterium]